MVWSAPGKLVAVVLGTVAVVAPMTLAGAAYANADASPPPAVAPSPSPAPTASAGINVTLHVKGGTLQLSADHVEVTLQRTASGHFVGRYEGVRVLDARGTMPGWQLTARISTATPAGSLRVEPDPMVAVYGSSDGLLDPGDGDVGDGGALLGGASAGHGAGIYELSGRVDFDVADGAMTPGASIDLLLEVR